MSKIDLAGIASAPDGERTVLYLTIEHNDTTYNWHIYMPATNTISEYLEARQQSILDDIDAKEALWANTAKTKIVSNDDLEVEVPVNKEEIVRADDVDYYMLRKKEYPPLPDQITAILKGSDELKNMAQRIFDIKKKYPKPT